MPDVRVSVNDQTYSLVCGDGEEERVEKLAAYFNDHVTRLSGELGKLGDSRLFLLAALNVCDELFTAREQLSRVGKDDPALTDMLNEAAERVETAAAALEATNPGSKDGNS